MQVVENIFTVLYSILVLVHLCTCYSAFFGKTNSRHTWNARRIVTQYRQPFKNARGQAIISLVVIGVLVGLGWWWMLGIKAVSDMLYQLRTTRIYKALPHWNAQLMQYELAQQ